MKGTIFAIFIVSLLLLAACGQKDASTEQSIQDIVGKQKQPFTTNATVTEPIEKNETAAVKENITEEEEEPVEVVGETPEFNKKCRYSTILYGGCKWTDNLETNFILKIMNGGKKTIPGIWFVYTGALGDVKTVRRNEEILSGGIRSYNIDYAKLAGEIGVVKKMEIYPIENINGSFACQNMRVYTIPEEYCKPAEATRINEDGSVNSTG
ncbi:TPA: hypothetical protein HA219_01255 [Candidatus Woesearchaeota archaeon]|nr:hypothetical protein [Candidatus Woesearchaeota archaeon]HIH39333.1 hypothetical protein [Candidatus Woesearchaeota archaeon]